MEPRRHSKASLPHDPYLILPPLQRKQELEAQRVARAEEARARAAYAQQRAAQAGEAEAAKRERLAAQLEVRLASAR